MIYFPPISELELVAVYDAGVPNKERVMLRATAKVNLAQFILGMHWQSPDGHVVPMQDYFWLGDQIIEPPTLVFIYSGIGTQQFGQFPEGVPYMTIHMGRKTTLFNRLESVPVLMRVDAINIGKHYDQSLGKLVSASKAIPNASGPLQLPGTT